MMSTVSQSALEAAMKAAVASGIIAKHADEQTYLRNWEGMKSVIAAALAAHPAEQAEYVTFESALEAIEHVEQSNSHGRADDARRMLVRSDGEK